MLSFATLKQGYESHVCNDTRNVIFMVLYDFSHPTACSVTLAMSPAVWFCEVMAVAPWVFAAAKTATQVRHAT